LEKLPTPLGKGAGWPKTKRQRELCWLHIVEGLGPKEAALKAGYKEITADKKAYALLRTAHRYCAQLQEKKNVAIERKFDVTVDKVADELAFLAFASHKEYIVLVPWGDGQRAIGKPISELTDQQARAIQAWDVRELKDKKSSKTYLDYRYTLYDKDGSLVDLGKHLGMFNEKLILEKRITKIHKIDLSGVPDVVLEKWMRDLVRHQGKQVIDVGPR
jgi:hypothetical protein